MSTVVVKDGRVDDALRNLRQRNVRNGLQKEAKERKHYVKPGVRRRKEKEDNIKNSRKRAKSFR